MALEWVRDGYSLWAKKSEAAIDKHGVAHWTVGVNFTVDDAWYYAMGNTERFNSLAEAKAWCQAQEDAAAPVELPQPSDVYEVPGKRETRRLVHWVQDDRIGYTQVGHGCHDYRIAEWQSWLRESGAVRIDGEERVRELEGEVARLRERIGTAARVNYDLRHTLETDTEATKALERERDDARAKLTKLQSEHEVVQEERNRLRILRDTNMGAACVRVGRAAGAAEMREERDKLVAELEDQRKRLEQERDDLRAKIAALERQYQACEDTVATWFERCGRLMEALRGIRGHDYNKCDHEDYDGCFGLIIDMADKAIAKEESHPLQALRDAALEAEVARLRAANARLLEALREIAELAADISYPDHAIRDMVDTKAREAAMLKVVGVETLEQANALGDKPRVAELEAEVARLRIDGAGQAVHWSLRDRVETAERRAKELEAEVARLQTQLRTERDGADTACRQLENGIEGLEAENESLRKRWEEATQERDGLRAAKDRLLEALREIQSDADAALSGVAFVVKLTSMRDRAREAIQREEGGRV